MNTQHLWQAGAAEIDITPAYGTQISGDIGRYRPVEEVHDPLYSRALVVEQSGRRYCIIVLDLCIATREWCNVIRQGVAEKYDIPASAVMVHLTQNHSGPALGHAMLESGDSPRLKDHRWLLGGDDGYHPVVVEKTMQAVGLAVSRLEPVEIGAGTAIEGRVAFCRRLITRDGTVVTNPPPGTPIRCTEGPSDPELGVVVFRNREKKPVATLLHFTCHPTFGYPTRTISADWPGAWAEGMKAHLGQDCVPLVINGCCGNVLHQDYTNPQWVNDCAWMGRVLTETAGTVLPQIEFQGEGTLEWRNTTLSLQRRQFDPQVIEKARDLLQRHPEPIWLEPETSASWEWMYALSVVDCFEYGQQHPIFPYEIQALRIGDIALAGIGGEPFVEAQLNIKLQSPAFPTFIAHMCNYYVGYIPTRQALARGGFETWPANWSKLEPDALELIANAVSQELHSLFPERPVKFLPYPAFSL